MSTEPTAEEEAAIRVRYGDRVVDISLPHGQQTVRMLLLAHDRASWDRYSDELMSSTSPDLVDANAIRRHLLWPSLEAFNRWSFGVAGHANTAMRALQRHAGDEDAGTSVEPLTDDTPPGVLEHAKLPPEKAAELLAAANGVVPYALVVVAGAGIVLRAPEPTILAGVRKAQTKGKGFASAARGAVTASVAWCSEPSLDELLARFPAVSTVLCSELLKLGGVGARATFRSASRDHHSSTR